jgi:3-oxoacyl-ACP reductase-like protein
MSIFSTILAKITGTSTAEAAQASASATLATATPASAEATPAAPAAHPGQSIDVAAVLDALEAKSKERLDWRHSIVDLMKLLNIDSSKSARNELARELHFDGDTDNSAQMNVWLHKQVMAKLAANGGKLPPELLS